MRLSIFLAALISMSGFARELNCRVMAKQITPLIEGAVNLDKKPSPASPAPLDTIARSEFHTEKPFFINGKSGVLSLRLTATYYEKIVNNVKISNVNDRFPAIDVGAFFYENDSTGTVSNDYSEIAVRFEGAPALDFYSAETGVLNYRIWTAGMGASLACRVIE